MKMNIETLFNGAFQDEQLQSKFYYELLVHPLYVVGESEQFNGTLEEGNELQLLRLRHEDVSYVPVFLSQESMDLFLDGSDRPYLKMMGSDLLETLKRSNIVINAGQHNCIILYADEIQHILSQGRN